MTKPSTINSRDPKYMNVHQWLIRKYGRAQRCENESQHIGRNYQWANVTGEYEKEVKNFKQLCRSCHAKLDMTEYCREQTRKRMIGNTNCRKPVSQQTKEGRELRRFVSLEEASKEVGVVRTAISNCLTGRSNSAAGSKWVYLNEGRTN